MMRFAILLSLLVFLTGAAHGQPVWDTMGPVQLLCVDSATADTLTTAAETITKVRRSKEGTSQAGQTHLNVTEYSVGFIARSAKPFWYVVVDKAGNKSPVHVLADTIPDMCTEIGFDNATTIACYDDHPVVLKWYGELDSLLVSEAATDTIEVVELYEKH